MDSLDRSIVFVVGLIMKMTFGLVAWIACMLLLPGASRGDFPSLPAACDTTRCDTFLCDDLQCSKSSSPTWWLSADALFLHRTQNYNQPIVLEEGNNSLMPVLTGDNLRFGTAAGPRFATGWTWSSGRTAELVYFGLNDWSSTARVTGNNNLSIPGDLGLATFDFFAADAMEVRYGSRIQNVEANLWNPNAGWDWLVGFRHFSVIEDFKISSFDADTYLSDYQIQTNNQLYGGQLGLRRRWTWDCFSFAPEAKFGLLGNANNQHTLIRDLENSKALRDVQVYSSILSSLSELRLVGDANLTKNLKLTFGYSLLWVTGVAQAPYQLDYTYSSNSSHFVDDNHSIFFQGANVGLNWLF